MTKAEQLQAVLLAASAFMAEPKLKEFEAKVTPIIGPKSRGVKANPEEYVKKDAKGNITHIMCSKSGVWLPANEEHFYPDLKGDGILGTGLKRLSRLGEKFSKQISKEIKDSKEKITKGIMSGEIDLPTAQKELKKLSDINVKDKVKAAIEAELKNAKQNVDKNAKQNAVDPKAIKKA